jgi:O-antigen/teichoic acid export membrane protein
LFFSNVESLIFAEVLSSAIVFLILMVLIYKVVPNDSGAIRLSSMKQMLQYSVPLGLSAMLGTVSLQLDQLIVSAMCTPEQYAVYANGTLEIPVVGIITGSIATIILAEMRKNVVDGDKKSALELFRRAALKSSPILIPLMFFLLLQAKPFIEVLYSKKYVDSIDPFRIYLFMLPARIVYYSSALLAFGLTRVVLFRSALSLVFNAILTVILVHFMGYMGAIISFVVVLYFWDVSFNFRILSKKFECHWYELLPMKEIGKMFLISAVCSIFILPFSFLEINNLLSLIISSVLFFPSVIFLLNKFKLIEFNWNDIKGKSKIWEKFRK